MPSLEDERRRAGVRSRKLAWSDGHEDQRRTLGSMGISVRDRATVQRLLTRQENHYHAIIRERDAELDRLVDSEAAMSVRLGVLERVSEAAEMKHAVERHTLEKSLAASAAELRAMRHDVSRARDITQSIEADRMAVILALGSELALVEQSEVEVRQVLGFLRRNNGTREQRLEALEAQVRKLRAANQQLLGQLAAQQKRAGHLGDRAVRLESLEARHKAALASAQRELSKALEENEALRARLGGEADAATAAREGIAFESEQLRLQQARRKSDGALGLEVRALRARVGQLSRTLERALSRDDVIVRAGGGFVSLPEFMQRLMLQSAPRPGVDDEPHRGEAPRRPRTASRAGARK